MPVEKDIARELTRLMQENAKLHLIGVAGSGMSGLAKLFLELGLPVSGCDRVRTSEVENLERSGLQFSSPQTAESLGDAKAVVYSSAIKPGNPGFDAAAAKGLPMFRRAEALAAVLGKKRGIVVAGTHGKTTTSALTAHLLRSAGLEPSHYVGAEIPVLGANARWSREGEWMVAEGDESDGTLVNFHPAIGILLNVEAEHLDYYEDGLAGIERVFNQFLDQVSEKVIFCGEDSGAARLAGARENVVSYGFDRKFDVSAEVTEERGASSDFVVHYRGEELGLARLGIPGRHNVLNALAATATALEAGADFDAVLSGLESFRGARRRFEIRYRSLRYTIVDDYGHHPTEIRATIRTGRAMKPERFVCVFQPHRYSRTKLLRDDFGKAFDDVDELFVTDVYPASEEPIPGISGKTIVDAVAEHGATRSTSIPDLDRARLRIGNWLRPGDMLLTLGAGNVHEVGRKLIADLELIDKLSSEINDPECDVRLYEPMRRHTTMKIGGPAQYWVEPHNVESFAIALNFFHERDIPVRVVGRGSNLLVRDGGIPGAVIHPAKGEFDEVRLHDNRLIAGAGVKFKKLSNVAKAEGIAGFEWMEGIPGSVGGGLRMNAGAMGVETFDQVLCVTFLDRKGNISEKSVDEIVAHYRNVPEMEDNFAVRAEFEAIPGDPAEIEKLIGDSMKKRKSSQPIAASSGCIFKNPDAVPAGKLIEELGLKNHAVGGARVSDVHGNFIVNNGKGTAEDVLELIGHIQELAREERGIELETEVQIIGEVAKEA
ncbi:MAG: UDP-N-acetylmuramate--L-alanine ligase [Verrucomicrobiota bacterium]